MNLSKRLTAVADMITPGNSIADIGTDHGYIPIYMAQKGLTPKALAMDVNAGPLERACDNIKRYCVENIVSARLSDGLKKLNPGEAESIIIAGMGGLLTIRILSDCPDVTNSAKELILSPHSDVNLVRKYLSDNNFCITNENIILEDDKFYFIIRACAGTMKLKDEVEEWFGQILLSEKNDILHQYLIKEESKRITIRQKMNANGSSRMERIEELEHELSIIRKALEFYES